MSLLQIAPSSRRLQTGMRTLDFAIADPLRELLEPSRIVGLRFACGLPIGKEHSGTEVTLANLDADRRFYLSSDARARPQIKLGHSSCAPKAAAFETVRSRAPRGRLPSRRDGVASTRGLQRRVPTTIRDPSERPGVGRPGSLTSSRYQPDTSQAM